MLGDHAQFADPPVHRIDLLLLQVVSEVARQPDDLCEAGVVCIPGRYELLAESLRHPDLPVHVLKLLIDDPAPG